MNPSILQGELATNLAWALVHFLWQGTAVAIGLKLVLVAWRNRSAQVRYLAGCGALAIAVSCPPLTFTVLHHAASSKEASLSSQIGEGPAPRFLPRTLGPELASVRVRLRSDRARSQVDLSDRAESRLGWVVAVWAAGVLAGSVRLAAGALQIRRLVRHRHRLDESEWNDRLMHAARRLRMSRPVLLAESAVVRVPTVLGWLRPCILLPVTTLTGLAPSEVEAILAHELAHVRRNDFVVNLLQNVVETLLFYHPAVWWISGEVRLEREQACDDLVVTAYGDPAGYARALANLEEICRDLSPALALSAAGGSLLRRIQRLLGRPAPSDYSAGWILSLAVTGAIALSLATRAHGAARSMGAVPAPSARNQPTTPDAVQANANSPRNDLALYTRIFKVDPGPFISRLREASGALGGRSALGFDWDAGNALLKERPSASPSGDSVAQSLLGPWNRQTPSSSAPLRDPSTFEILRNYLESAGVHLHEADATSVSPTTNSDQRALFFNELSGALLVRASQEELDHAEKAIQVLNTPPPQVLIETKFTEVSSADLRVSGVQSILSGTGAEAGQHSYPLQVTNRNGVLSPQVLDPKGKPRGDLFENPGLRNLERVRPGVARILTDPQFRTLLRALEQTSAAETLAAPRVSTLSGRPAEFEVVDSKSIVTGVSISTDAQNETKVNYLTSELSIGPSVEVIPYVSADGKEIRLTLIITFTEFLGYDHPEPVQITGEPGAKMLEIQRPLPHFQVRRTLAKIDVPDGQTVVISGFGASLASESRPKGGKEFRSDSAQDRELLIFLTPVVITPEGNPVRGGQ